MQLKKTLLLIFLPNCMTENSQNTQEQEKKGEKTKGDEWEENKRENRKKGDGNVSY